MTPPAVGRRVVRFSAKTSGEAEACGDGGYSWHWWFDLQLKGRIADDRADWAAQRTDALRRLTAETFDASVDGSSIGQGRFDPTTMANRPYTLEGLRTDDNLSRLFRSAYDMAGLRCDNMVAGC